MAETVDRWTLDGEEIELGACGAVHLATGAACWLLPDHRSSHEAPRPVPGLSRREQAERELVIWARTACTWCGGRGRLADHPCPRCAEHPGVEPGAAEARP